MQFVIKYYKDIAITISWISIMLTIFIQDTSVYANIEEKQQLWFFCAAPFFVILSSILLWKKKPRYVISGWDLCYWGVIVYTIIIYYITPFPSPYKWTQSILLLNCVGVLRIWLYRNQMAKRIVIYTLCTTGAIIAIWAILQLWGILQPNHSLFPLTGPFQNTGPFSGFIAMLLPIALHQTLLSGKYFRKWRPITLIYIIPTISLVIMILVLPAGFSRIAWLAAFVSCVYLMFDYFKIRKKITDIIQKKRGTYSRWSLGFLVIIITASCIMYHFKKDSADGRLLIWKLSLYSMFEESVLFGKGLGTFPQEYRKAQIDYMKNGSPSLQEKRVADAPEYAFNEYLQIGIEQGIIGLTLYILLLAILINRAKKHKNSLGILCSIISFSIFSFASYPMSLLPFWIILITIPALIHDSNVKKRDTTNHKSQKILLIITISTVFISLYRKQNREKYLSFNEIDISLIIENDINRHHYDPNTMFYCGKLLFDKAIITSLNNEQLLISSLKYFKQGEKRSCDPMFQVMIGRCHEELDEFKKAEEHFLEAHYMTPNRLYPLYRLALLHKDDSILSPETSIYYAKKLLDSPVKITSPATEDMRRHMKKLIKELDSQASTNEIKP